MVDLEFWRQLDQAATPGPWTYDPADGGMIDSEEAAVAFVAWYSGASFAPREVETHSRADGRFIAAARTGVPTLVAEVERLRDLLDERNEALAELERLRSELALVTGQRENWRQAAMARKPPSFRWKSERPTEPGLYLFRKAYSEHVSAACIEPYNWVPLGEYEYLGPIPVEGASIPEPEG